jgi:hypothetical protein
LLQQSLPAEAGKGGAPAAPLEKVFADDLDMAAEIMEFTKSNILNQAATAMLAQANMAPQTVLQLLG